MDDDNFDRVPIQDGEVLPGEPIASVVDGAVVANALGDLGFQAEQAGIPGGPFEFGDADRHWATELNRLRASLWTLIKEGNRPGYKAWALVSDPILVAADAVGTLYLQRDGELPKYREARYIVRTRSGEAGAVATKVRGQIVIVSRFRRFYADGALGTFVITTGAPTAAHKLFRSTISAPEKSNPGNGFDFDPTPPAEPADVAFAVGVFGKTRPDFNLLGRTDLFEVYHSSWVLQGGGNSINNLYVYLRAKTVADLSDPYTTLGAEETFALDIEVLGGRQLSARECFTRLVIGVEEQELTFRGARVLTSEVGDWCHMPLNTDGLGYRVNGAFVGQLFYLRADVMAQVLQGRTDGVWRARTAPIGTVSYPAIGSKFEGWKRSRRALGDKTFMPYVPPSGFTPANEQEVRAPVAELTKAYWSGRTGPTELGATWANFSAVDVEVPADLLGPVTFDIRGVYIQQAELQPTTTTCYYYRVPLPGITREQAIASRWDITKQGGQAWGTRSADAAGVNYAGVHRVEGIGFLLGGQDFGKDGTPAGPVFFHDARLLDRAGGTFWFQHLYADHVAGDLTGRAWHFCHWLVADGSFDGGAATGEMFLYLLLDQKETTIGVDASGPIAGPISYWPAVGFSDTDYREAWSEGRAVDERGVIERLHGNNWTEFNAPYLLAYRDAPRRPVPLWTVGRSSGGAWTPGTQLRLYLPRKVSKADLMDFADFSVGAVDVTVGNAAYWSNAYQFGGGVARSSEIYDLSIFRQPHKRQVLVLRNGVATLPYWPVVDMRLHRVLQSHVNGWLAPEYPEPEGPEDWLRATFNRWEEIDPIEYRVTPAGNSATIKFENTAAARPSWRPEADEFDIVLATFQTRIAGVPGEMGVEFGNMGPGGEFALWGTVGIDPTQQRVIYPFLASDANEMDQRWIARQVWPIAYRRVLRLITPIYEQEAHTFGVNAGDGRDHSIAGVLVYVTVPEDATVRYQSTWRAKLFHTYAELRTEPERANWVTDGEKIYNTVIGDGVLPTERVFADGQSGEALDISYVGGFLVLKLAGVELDEAVEVIEVRDRTWTTEHPFLKGRQLVPPRQMISVAVPAAPGQEWERMIRFTHVSARQNWDARVAGKELMAGAVPGAEIVGLPRRFHFNETLRLVKAYAENS